jgi:hypothetical protein
VFLARTIANIFKIVLSSSNVFSFMTDSHTSHLQMAPFSLGAHTWCNYANFLYITMKDVGWHQNCRTLISLKCLRETGHEWPNTRNAGRPWK